MEPYRSSDVIVYMPERDAVTAQSRLQRTLSTVRSGMSANVGKWTGIAAGAGLILGIAGRMMRSRRRHDHRHDAIFVIGSAC